MFRIFITILNMSPTASYCIAVVIVLRFFLRRQPKIFSYLLWSVVFFRLLCPFSLSSAYSLVWVNTNIISQETMDRWTVSSISTAGLHTTEDRFMTQETHNSDIHNTETGREHVEGLGLARLLKALIIAARIWIIGIVLLICYSIGTAYRLHRSLRQVVRIGENQYEAEHITTPFVFGIIKPRIYLPAHLSEEERKYVLTHEKIHIARKDYLVKIAAYGAACIHWFNPFVWLAFVLMENDMEMSCDEAVLRKLGIENKKEYSLSLLSLSSGKAAFRGSPLAFGEGKVKSRVKNILSYRPGRLAAVIAVVIFLVIIIGGLMLNPAEKQRLPKEEDREKITELIENYADAFCGRNGAVIAASYADEEAALANAYDMLDKAGGEYTFGFSSPWPDSYRYVIDWEHEKADIWYYAWTSDPHVTVWKEEKYYDKFGEEYRVTDGSLEYMDSISSKEEFDEAYRIQREYLFVDYEENGFADAISYQIENGTSAADNTVYNTPQTAAEYILNLTGGESVVEGRYTIQATVRYRFADGSEVMIPMYMVQENIWIVDVAVWNAGAPD